MQDHANDAERKSRHDALTRDLLERVTRAFGGESGFDPMEIARALAGVAFLRLDMVEDKDVAAGYYRHLQGCCERARAAGQEFVRGWAKEHEAETKRRSLS